MKLTRIMSLGGHVLTDVGDNLQLYVVAEGAKGDPHPGTLLALTPEQAGSEQYTHDPAPGAGTFQPGSDS